MKYVQGIPRDNSMPKKNKEKHVMSWHADRALCDADKVKQGQFYCRSVEHNLLTVIQTLNLSFITVLSKCLY